MPRHLPAGELVKQILHSNFLCVCRDWSHFCFTFEHVSSLDYLKYDNCGEVNLQSFAKFQAMRDALNATNRSIFFSFEPHVTVPIDWLPLIGNSWRTGGDITDTFASVLNNLRINNAWAAVLQPGAFNDADMLEVGNSGLSVAEVVFLR